MSDKRPSRCRHANRYQAIRSPKCQGGVGCIACWTKWRAKQKEIADALALARKAPPAKFKRPIEGKRFIITSAQNATPVNEDFLATLKVAAKHMEAELVVIPLRYKNPTSRWTESQKNAEWWGVSPNVEKAAERAGEENPNPLKAHLFNSRKKLNDNLVLVGDVKTQPTASSPLTGFESLTGSESCIIGHTKLQMKVVPVPTGKFPKILTTTGSCTLPNYTDSKAGALGSFHHHLGAIVVEIQSDKKFHLRQIGGDSSDGSFTDLDQHYTKDGVSEAPPALGLVMGDTHARFIDPKVDQATFGAGGIIETLNPNVLVFHDVIDGYSANPHHEGNPFIKLAKYRSGLGGVRAEVEHAIRFLEKRCKDKLAVIVASNHDNFLERWILHGDWKMDPENAVFYLQTALMMAQSTQMTSKGTDYADPFRHWAEELTNGLKLKCLGSDESFKLHNIECGMHGHRGPNGAKGTLKNLSRLGSRVISGHTHTPGIEEGHYQCGTSTPLRLEYTHGPGSWLNTHCIVYATGKRSLITIVDGAWRG